MQFTLSWLELAAVLIAGGGIVAALTIGTVLFSRPSGSRQANVALGALLVLAAAVVLYVVLLYIQPPGENLSVVFAPLPFTFALGPLFYAYVRARLGYGLPGVVHAVLPIAQAVLVIGIALSPLATQQRYMGEMFAPWWGTTQTALFALSLAIYLALSWRMIPETASYAWARDRDRWLRQFVTVGVLSLMGVVVFALIGPLFPDLPGQRFFGLSWVSFLEVLLYSGIVYAIAVGGWVQAEVGAEADTSTRSTSVDPQAASHHAAALDALIRDEQPYLDPNLSLGSLAGQLGMTDKALSGLLNDTLGTSYTDYVNRLRVDEARRRLADPDNDHLTVLAVGLDAGFASKSTFNRVFKAETGETPSAFRQRAEATHEATEADRPIAV